MSGLYREPRSLSSADAARVLRLLAVTTDAVEELRALLVGNGPAGEVLGEVERLLELVGVHAAAEVEIANETRRSA